MTEIYKSVMEPKVRRGMQAVVLAVTVSTTLALIKIAAGLFGRSYALIADGIESCLDVLSSLMVYSGLRIAASPPDERHPYGHGKAETLAGLAVGLLLLGAAFLIAGQSVLEILNPSGAPRPWTLWVLIGVVSVKELMFRVLHEVGRKTGSSALQADAWHQRSDALTSLAAFLGISVSLLMGPGWEAADDWAALAACGIIFLSGVRLLRRSAEDVMDAAPPPSVTEAVRDTAQQVDQVDNVETCWIRKSGPGWLVDIHVIVDGSLSVACGHAIAHAVKDALLKSDFGILNAQVHVEPPEAHPELDDMKSEVT